LAALKKELAAQFRWQTRLLGPKCCVKYFSLIKVLGVETGSREKRWIGFG
jgi:hypothetical protein